MKKMIQKFNRDEEGATMVEYGLMVALVALIVAAGASIFGTALAKLFTDIATTLGTYTS